MDPKEDETRTETLADALIARLDRPVEKTKLQKLLYDANA